MVEAAFIGLLFAIAWASAEKAVYYLNEAYNADNTATLIGAISLMACCTVLFSTGCASIILFTWWFFTL